MFQKGIFFAIGLLIFSLKFVTLDYFTGGSWLVNGVKLVWVEKKESFY